MSEKCMEKLYRIAYVTGSRADYGIVRRYLKYLDSDVGIDLELLITGALLKNEYGHQVDLIYKDRIKIGAEIEIPIDTKNNAGILKTMAKALDGFGSFFERKKYNLLIILGDRYEILSVAIAAAMQRIPILHIHGGEATYGNYDEFIRHSITKMSRFHFTATEGYRRRVIQLGEDPNRVFYLGALGAENCTDIEKGNVPDDVKNLESKSYFVVLFHPETLSDADPYDQVQELLLALNHFEEKIFIFIGSNADTQSDRIREEVFEYVKKHDNTFYFENLHTDAYHYLVKNAIALVGNSSSGIIEAPSLGVLTINIGNRQKGRIRGNSVIDIPCLTENITEAIKKAINGDIKININNPYYKKNTALNYYKYTLYILEKLKKGSVCSAKEFFDLIDLDQMEY